MNHIAKGYFFAATYGWVERICYNCATEYVLQNGMATVTPSLRTTAKKQVSYRYTLDGAIYIFVNPTCTSMEILHMECGGLVIYHMKLEQGCFKLPVFDPGTHAFQTSWQDLMMMVQGISPDGGVNINRWKKPSIF